VKDLRAVFVYGTLQFDDVVEAVTGRRFEGVKASLEDYGRRRVRDRRYPGVFPEPGSRTEGVLYRGVDAAALALLDLFEGDLYDRVALQVCVDEGPAGAQTWSSAWTYVVAPRHRALLSDELWDAEAFLREHGAAYLAACRRFPEEEVR
jgi:gamma-glutamylcyclotransferase (GGCT)/AIG2-like uncharacterized protein YtfP